MLVKAVAPYCIFIRVSSIDDPPTAHDRSWAADLPPGDQSR